MRKTDRSSTKSKSRSSDWKLQCGRKVRHASAIAAQKAASENRKLYGEAMEAYRCPWCKRWHIGHRS